MIRGNKEQRMEQKTCEMYKERMTGREGSRKKGRRKGNTRIGRKWCTRRKGESENAMKGK